MDTHLSLGQPVVDDVHEPERAHRIMHLSGEFCAALRRVGFRDVNGG